MPDSIWRCPKSKSPLLVDAQAMVCTDSDCRLRFEIKDGIPVMLVDQATELTAEDWNEFIRRAESEAADSE